MGTEPVGVIGMPKAKVGDGLEPGHQVGEGGGYVSRREFRNYSLKTLANTENY